MKFNITKLEQEEIKADMFKVEFNGKAVIMTITDNEYDDCMATPLLMVNLIINRLKFILEFCASKPKVDND